MKNATISSHTGIIEFSPLNSFSGITHFFTTREAGNMGLHVVTTKDELEKTVSNRQRVCQLFGIDLNYLVTTQQVHSACVIPVNRQMRGMGAKVYKEAISACDGLLTNDVKVPLAIFVADCLPLYIYDRENKAIGLIHAGKKGTQLQIAKEALRSMKKEYKTNPENCIAFLGPAIGPCCIELDLYNLNREQLEQEGFLKGNIYSVDACTSCQNQIFYSFRKEKDRAGRMMALFMLNGREK